jgi:hypothetical protein
MIFDNRINIRSAAWPDVERMAAPLAAPPRRVAFYQQTARRVWRRMRVAPRATRTLSSPR